MAGVVGFGVDVRLVAGQWELNVHVGLEVIRQGEGKVRAVPALGGFAGLLGVVYAFDQPGQSEYVVRHPLAPGAATLRACQHLVKLARRCRKGGYGTAEGLEISLAIHLHLLKVLAHLLQPLVDGGDGLVDQLLFSFERGSGAIGEHLAVRVQRLGGQRAERIAHLPVACPPADERDQHRYADPYDEANNKTDEVFHMNVPGRGIILRCRDNRL